VRKELCRSESEVRLHDTCFLQLWERYDTFGISMQKERLTISMFVSENEMRKREFSVYKTTPLLSSSSHLCFSVQLRMCRVRFIVNRELSVGEFEWRCGDLIRCAACKEN
jgi:hypothetical protein